MAGVGNALFVPGSRKVSLPRTTNGIGVFSMGLVVPESEALDLLLFDLPPGAERHADFLGPQPSFLLVTIPSEVSRGVVARSAAALSPRANRVLGYVENMSG